MVHVNCILAASCAHKNGCVKKATKMLAYFVPSNRRIPRTSLSNPVVGLAGAAAGLPTLKRTSQLLFGGPRQLQQLQRWNWLKAEAAVAGILLQLLKRWQLWHYCLCCCCCCCHCCCCCYYSQQPKEVIGLQTRPVRGAWITFKPPKRTSF